MSTLIGGEWIETAARLPVTNKFTGEVIVRVSIAQRVHITQAVTAAKLAMLCIFGIDFSERG